MILMDFKFRQKIDLAPVLITAMATVSSSELKALEECLLNVSGKFPLHVRFRALFTLKGLASDEAVQIIGKGV